MPLVDLRRVMTRHWRLSAGFLVASVVVTTLVLWLAPRSYRSESKLYVRMGRESASLDPTAVIGRSAASTPMPTMRENEINSVTEILLSNVLLERLVDSIGPRAILDGTDVKKIAKATTKTSVGSEAKTKISEMLATALGAEWPGTLDDRDRAILELRDMIEVEAVKRSDVIKVSCEAENPRLAQELVSELVDFSLAEHLRLNRTLGAREFLERETNDTRKRLTQTEDELRKLKDQSGLAAPEIQRDLLVRREGRLQDELFTAASELESAKAKVALLREQLSTIPKTTVVSSTEGLRNYDSELMRNELYRLEMLEQELSSKFTDEHFAVQQARERTAAARKVLDDKEALHDTVTNGPNSVYEATEKVLLDQEPLVKALEAKTELLQTQLAEVRKDITTFNSEQVKIAQLTRDQEQLERDYLAYAKHLEETRIDEALEAGRISSINIIQPATLELKPVSPRRLLIACLGLVIGVVGAVVLPLLVETWDLRLRHPQDVESYLGVPVLASVPRFRPEQLGDNGENS
jgi:uncharacterized protein involved in exopolysaccharide biosynthesis